MKGPNEEVKVYFLLIVKIHAINKNLLFQQHFERIYILLYTIISITFKKAFKYNFKYTENI